MTIYRLNVSLMKTCYLLLWMYIHYTTLVLSWKRHMSKMYKKLICIHHLLNRSQQLKLLQTILWLNQLKKIFQRLMLLLKSLLVHIVGGNLIINIFWTHMFGHTPEKNRSLAITVTIPVHENEILNDTTALTMCRNTTNATFVLRFLPGKVIWINISVHTQSHSVVMFAGRCSLIQVQEIIIMNVAYC